MNFNQTNNNSGDVVNTGRPFTGIGDFIQFTLVTFGMNEDGKGDIFTREASIAAAESAVKRGIIHSFQVIDGDGGGWIEAWKYVSK